MTIGIYYIKNNINNKYYIGQSVNIEKRKYRHFNNLQNNNHDNKHLQQAYNKYGKKAFTFKIIKACKPQYLNRLEKLYIKAYNSYNNGYNLTIGGENLRAENNPFYNRKHKLKTCINKSSENNTTGFFRVYYDMNRYKYRWYENRKRKSISAKNINTLEQKVQSKGLPWYKL